MSKLQEISIIKAELFTADKIPIATQTEPLSQTAFAGIIFRKICLLGVKNVSDTNVLMHSFFFMIM